MKVGLTKFLYRMNGKLREVMAMKYLKIGLNSVRYEKFNGSSDMITNWGLS